MAILTHKLLLQKIKNYFWHLPKSIFYCLYYGFPSKKLTLIGITGTDGKTTSASLIHETMLNSGINTGLISTLGAKVGNKHIPVGLHTTSPDSSIVQKIFKSMVDEGLTHVVVEVTAHAIDQFRFFGCHFTVSAITNTSHEHLDDFLNLKSYIETKSKLFKSSAMSILNADDQSFAKICQVSKLFKSISIVNPSDYRAKNIKISDKSLQFSVDQLLFKTDSNYYYQIYNILVTLAVIDFLHIDPKYLIETIAHFPIIKGRRETIENRTKIKCIVDFAHTPAALSSTLSSLKLSTKGKLIVIFGATGGRDQSKRPIMGEIVSKIADIAIVTADDTRNEKVKDINEQIISGFSKSRIAKNMFKYHNIYNRQEAFNLALKLASPGDTVIACGKGHENTILHGQTEYPWSESEAFRTAIRNKKL